MRKSFILCFLPLLIFAAGSCKRNQYRVNVSDISVSVKIQRLEKDLFTLNPEDIPSSVASLKQKYGAYLQLFSYVINTGDINDPAFGDFLVRFCTDRQNNEVYDSTQKVFPDVQTIEAGLQDAFRHYRYYLPEKPVPENEERCRPGIKRKVVGGTALYDPVAL